MQSRELVKLYYRIGEVSDIVGVQPHVLRYWETEFRSIRPQKSSKGQRVYSRRDVEKLLRVKDLLKNQGFTIAGARKRLSEGEPERAREPGYERAREPGYERAHEPGYERAREPGYERAREPGYERAREPGYERAHEPGNERAREPGYERARGPDDAPRWRERDHDRGREPEQSLRGREPDDPRARSLARLEADSGAKKMRKALLGLRQDLLRMLEQISEPKAR